MFYHVLCCLAAEMTSQKTASRRARLQQSTKPRGRQQRPSSAEIKSLVHQKKEFRLHRDHIQVRLLEALIQALIIRQGSSSVSNNSVPSQSQSELDDAESFLNSGMYTDAREMLDSIDKSGLSDSQLTQYESIESRLENHENSGGSSSSGYTPQEAVKIVEDHYGITINYDTNGLQLQTNSGGTEYYQLQIELKNENLRKIVNVYKNGEIEEISSEPLAYG